MAVINGGFETGDLTGWTDSSIGTSNISISSSPVHTGSYSCDMNYNDNFDLVEFCQDIDLTDENTLTLWAISEFGSQQLGVAVDANASVYKTISTSWTECIFDVSSYSGICRVYIQSMSNLTIDDIVTSIPTAFAQVNISDSWREVDAMKINIDGTWENVVGIQQNIDGAWETVF